MAVAPEDALVPVAEEDETLFSEAQGTSETRDYLASAIRPRDGAEPVSRLLRGRLAEGESRFFDVVVGAGTCDQVTLQGGIGVLEIDLAVVRQSDLSVLEQGVDADMQSVVGAGRTLCATEATTTYLLLATVVRGGGELAIQAFALPPAR